MIIRLALKSIRHDFILARLSPIMIPMSVDFMLTLRNSEARFYNADLTQIEMQAVTDRVAESICATQQALEGLPGVPLLLTKPTEVVVDAANIGQTILRLDLPIYGELKFLSMYLPAERAKIVSQSITDPIKDAFGNIYLIPRLTNFEVELLENSIGHQEEGQKVIQLLRQLIGDDLVMYWVDYLCNNKKVKVDHIRPALTQPANLLVAVQIASAMSNTDTDIAILSTVFESIDSFIESVVVKGGFDFYEDVDVVTLFVSTICSLGYLVNRKEQLGTLDGGFEAKITSFISRLSRFKELNLNWGDYGMWRDGITRRENQEDSVLPMQRLFGSGALRRYGYDELIELLTKH